MPFQLAAFAISSHKQSNCMFQPAMLPFTISMPAWPLFSCTQTLGKDNRTKSCKIGRLFFPMQCCTQLVMLKTKTKTKPTNKPKYTITNFLLVEERMFHPQPGHSLQSAAGKPGAIEEWVWQRPWKHPWENLASNFSDCYRHSPATGFLISRFKQQ